MISKALEEYLKTMYVLKNQNGYIRVTDIAEKMGCSKPGANKAVNSLKEKGLVNYETYGEINLTEEGEELAKKVLEMYDIAYLFFKEILGLSPNEAKSEAEQIKSVISDNTINKLAKYVHKTLNLNSLDCDYDVNNQRCRECVRRERKI